jgi:hypothetical protein
MDSK